MLLSQLTLFRHSEDITGKEILGVRVRERKKKRGSSLQTVPLAFFF